MKWKRGLSMALAVVLTWSSVPQDALLRARAQEDPAIVTESGQSRTMDFNEDWRFEVWPNAGENKRTYAENDLEIASGEYDDSAWRTLNLPHDWSIEEDFTSEVSVEYGALPTGIGWYRKKFTLPESCQGKRINLDFGGVFANAQIYVNGTRVGEYYYGYNSFSFDITDYVICDGETENLVAVKVDSPKNGSRWYTGSGIYRDVSLTITDVVHVAGNGTVVYAPDLEREYGTGSVTTKIQTTMENEGTDDVTVQVRNTILEYESKEAFSGAEVCTSEEVFLAAGEKREIEQQIQTMNPRLWSVDAPNLYWMKTEILCGGQVVDVYETRFGYKWCEFDADEGFSLNGQWMKLRGVCMHHDQGALGAAAYDAAIYRQMRIMKEMGANAVRVTHNPADEALIQACDELGLMVVEEGFDGWWSAKDSSGYADMFRRVCTHPDAEAGVTWGEYDFQQMIRRDRNAPSIIMWSLGNEVYENNEEAVEWIRKAAEELVPQADPAGHLLTAGDNQFKRITSYNGNGSRARMNANLDVVGLNYSEEQYDNFHNNWEPDWILYGSETASAVSSRGWYSDPDKTTGASAIEEYNLSSYDNSSVSWGRTATDSLIPDRDRKYIAGQFVWTGFDYIGEPSPFGSKGGSSQSGPKSSFFGAVDTAGFAKDNYYLYQSQWLDRKSDPMVHILPHWNWEDEDLRELVTVDGKIPVRVYSNASAVELFVNGVSQGKKEFARMETDYGVSYQQQSEDSDRLYLEWPLTWNYAVGTSIEAVAYDESGAEIARDQMVTAGEPAGLSAESDRSVISADGYDLAYITIDVQDANGNFMPTADNEIYFHISGDGEIVGVDNGDAASWERYQDYDGVWKRKAYSGKALVIVKSTKEEGSFTVTASSPGLNQDSVTVYTKDSQSSQEGILGYETPSIAVDVGTKPEDVILPEKVNAIRADGSEMEVQVIWNPLSEESLLSAGEFEIEGKTQDGAAVKAVVSVRGPVGIREITVGVVKENLPVMPGEAELVWSDGKTQSVDVDWEEITPEQTVKAGTFEVKGKVAGYEEFEAIAHIVVVDSATEQNVALANAGSSVSVSYEEGSHKASHLIDGITDNEDNGWGNWQKEGRFEDWATVNFPQEYTVSKAVLRLSDTNTWQLPDRVLISYLDEETGEYQTVKNQSLITGFVGGINANTITFDPVTTDKLRFTFYIDGNAYDSGKDMIKVNEIEVYADILPLEKEAELAELSVNGESIQEFEPGRYHYVYSLGYSEKVPEISAKAGDGATVFIRQAMSGSGSAFVEVTSQDGQTTNTYTVQFSRKSPALIQVLFENLPETVTEDDITELFVKGMMEDGKTIDGSSASVTYEVADGEDGGHAQIRDGKLYAYDSGTVTITATMTYKGTSCKAEPVSVEILENTAQKEVQSFEKVHVRAKKGIIPDLPAKITVYYNTGLPRSLDVTWDPVGEEIYASEGRFQVSGTVEGITQRPVAVIDMVDIVAAQNLSMAVAEGYEPELPDATTVYYSDGVTEEAQVEWEKVPVNGVYTGYVKDTDVPVACRVRIAEDTEKSVNYVIKYNGWGLPDGLASYTNDQVVNDKSSDSATHINDGYVEFSNASEKRIWCNYVPSTLDPDKVQRSEDWVAAPIAVSGKIQEKTVDQVSFAVIDEESGSTKTIKVPKAYYVEYYVGPDYSQMLMEHYTTAGITYGGHMENETYWPDNPLMNEENWKEVTYVSKAELPSGKNGDWKKMLNVTFQPVKTSLVRIRMEAYEDYCLGVDELEVYGTEAKEESGIEGADVFVDGESCISEFANHSLTISTVPGEDFPKITASAKNNAAVTVIPATDFNPTATVLFVPEDGNEVHTERYTITFVQDALSYEELQEKLQAALEQIGQLEQRLSAKEKELEAALMEQNRLTEELNREHDNVTSLTERLETMQSQLAALQLSGSANEEEIRNLTSQITQLQTQLADAKTKEADLTQRLTEMEGEILLLQEERDLLKENVSRAEQAASSAKEALEKAQQEAESAKQEADKLREEADQAKTEKEQADKETAAAQAALKNAQEELQKLSEELQSLKAEQKNGQLPKEGDIFTVKGVKYRITDETKKQAEAYKAADKNAKTVRVPATVKIEGNAYKVTAVADSAFAKMKNLRKIVIGNQVTKIGRKAFFGDRKLKSIQIKSRKLKRVGAQALKNIFSKAVVKVPKGKKKAYTKLVKGKGQRKTVLIK